MADVYDVEARLSPAMVIEDAYPLVPFVNITLIEDTCFQIDRTN